MRIEVTAEDIANGKAGEGDKCPIALACRRAGLAAWVGLIGIYFSEAEYETPNSIPDVRFTGIHPGQFVADFDEGADESDFVRPFDFELNYELPTKAGDK